MSGHSKWANIKRKKGKNDAIRGKITTKIGREITIAVRMGGPDPVGNMRLKLALQKAKENNIPKDNIKRAIQKGAGATEGQNYEEITYEATARLALPLRSTSLRITAIARPPKSATYSPNTATASAKTGCVGWMFKSKGIFVVSKENADEDQIMEVALEAGADDVKTEGEEFEIVTTPEAFDDVEKALADAGIETEHASITMVPDNTITLDAEGTEKLEKLIDALEDLDDVQDVYHNGDMVEDEE